MLPALRGGLSRALAAGLCAWTLGCTVADADPERRPAPASSASAVTLTSAGDHAPASALPVPAPPPAPARRARPVRVAFVGDVSLSFHITAYLEGFPAEPPIEPLFPFAAVASQLASYDLTVGNLECVISSLGDKTRRKVLRAPVSAPRLLRDAGFDVLSVANNHSLDLGEVGYRQTLSRLQDEGLTVAGAHMIDERLDPVAITSVDGLRIAIVGHYNREPRRAMADLARARAGADVVIVFVHWGNDWEPSPLRFQRQWGRKLIDAGADAVVGAHPHVVQPDELYQGKLIAHSLGNFVFSAMTRPGTRLGALLELDLDDRGVVDHRYRKVALDDRGAAHLEGEPTRAPPLDPALDSMLAPLGKPIDFGLDP